MRNYVFTFAEAEIAVSRAHDTHTEFNDTTLKLKICGELLNLDTRTHKHLQLHSKITQKKIQNQKKSIKIR